MRRLNRFISNRVPSGNKSRPVVAVSAPLVAAAPALAGGPQIPDVGIDVGAMAQNMGTALGSTLGEIIPVALGFVIVSIGVVWLVKWLRRS